MVIIHLKIYRISHISTPPFRTAGFSPGINSDNANKIGLEIPEHILKQAEIIRSAS